MTWTIYFLSITDGFSTVCAWWPLMLVLACGSYIGEIVTSGEVAKYKERSPSSYEASYHDEATAFMTRWRAARQLFVTCLIVMAVLSALVPTRSALIESYVMVESRKVLNAPNAEKAATEARDALRAIVTALSK